MHRVAGWVRVGLCRVAAPDARRWFRRRVLGGFAVVKAPNGVVFAKRRAKRTEGARCRETRVLPENNQFDVDEFSADWQPWWGTRACRTTLLRPCSISSRVGRGENGWAFVPSLGNGGPFSTLPGVEGLWLNAIPQKSTLQVVPG